jgi:hypothetical protein
MKRTFILTTMAVISAALIFSSCGPSKVYANKEKNYRNPAPPPSPSRYYRSVSLIISPTPGFVMKQNPNGRFYHITRDGYQYWKGYDNRFYLDKSYLNRISYTKWEYKEWKQYSKGSR